MRNVLSHLKVGFDFDSILADTDGAALQWLQHHGHVPMDKTRKDITDWCFTKCLGAPEEAVREMFAHPAFFFGLPPIDGGLRLMCLLHAAGAEIHVVTDCPCREERSSWLAKEGASFDHLEFVKGGDKHYYAANHELDFFLEDNPTTAYNMAGAVRGMSFLRDRPYNQGAGFHKKLRRFYTYEEMFDFFLVG